MVIKEKIIDTTTMATTATTATATSKTRKLRRRSQLDETTTTLLTSESDENHQEEDTSTSTIASSIGSSSNKAKEDSGSGSGSTPCESGEGDAASDNGSKIDITINGNGDCVGDDDETNDNDNENDNENDNDEASLHSDEGHDDKENKIHEDLDEGPGSVCNDNDGDNYKDRNLERTRWTGPKWKANFLLILIKQVRVKVDPCNLFTKSIDPIEDDCPDYYDVISKEEAMSFETMEQLVKGGELVDIDTFEICLNRIVANAKKYHANQQNIIIRYANKIKSRAAPVIEKARSLWNEIIEDYYEDDDDDDDEHGKGSEEYKYSEDVHEIGTNSAAEAEVEEQALTTGAKKELKFDGSTQIAFQDQNGKEDKREQKLEDDSRSSRRQSSRIRNASRTENENESGCTEGRVKSETDHKREILKDLVKKIGIRVDPYGFFSRPVDPVDDECPDYYNVIDRENEAMCFSLMQELIDDGTIADISGVEKYLQRIIFCAQKYNGDEDNYVRIQADQIEEKSAPIIKIARQKWKTIEQKFKKGKNGNKASASKGKSWKRQQRYKGSSDEGYESSGESSCSEGGVRMSMRNRKVKKTRSSRRKQKKRRTVNQANVESSSDESRSNKPYVIEGSEIPFCSRDLSSSIMIPCNDRDEWRKLCPKLATVCNEAARRSTLRVNPKAKRYEKPLSEVYIEERLTYDDPVNGFVVKTKNEPHHVQGFIITTDFVTMRRTFRWSTTTPASIVTPTDHRIHATDISGELSEDLQKVKREGSDSAYGFTSERVCEISLLGGLGCGGALLARALSELRQSGKYDYVVLQATKIAIPFYEKHGFVRVGCVTRFNDNEALPEVAYRHWSEIVNGEAVEPSYMMARRLSGDQKVDAGCWARRTRTRITKEEREMEIKSALKSAHSLLSDALLIRAGTSNVYINSYREILSATKEFALSAEDFDLVEVIERALSEVKGSAIGASKSMIRQELKLPKAQKGKTSKSPEKDHSDSSRKDCSDDDQIVDVNVSVICKSVKRSPLFGSLSRSFLDTNPFHQVRVSLSGPQYKCREPLLANIRVAASSTSKIDFVDAMTMAICNLKSYFCNVPSRNDNRRKSEQIVKKGQSIMLKVDGFGGLPLWVSAEVEKFCGRKSSADGNMFVVNWEHESTGGIKRERRLLDITNRGVGRDWCTDLDWSSFSMLPIEVLDTLILGSWVEYQDLDGTKIKGSLVKRVGGGLNGDPKYRLSSWRKGRKKQCPDLTALQVREVVTIDDERIARASVILDELTFEKVSPFQSNEGTQQSLPGNNVRNNKVAEPHVSEEWASYRFLEFDLGREKVHSFKEVTDDCEKIDDKLIHLSTGVDSVAKNLLSCKKKKPDVGKKIFENEAPVLKVSSPSHSLKKNKCQLESPILENSPNEPKRKRSLRLKSIVQNSSNEPDRKRSLRRNSRPCNYAESPTSSESDQISTKKRRARHKKTIAEKEQIESTDASDGVKRTIILTKRGVRSRSSDSLDENLSASGGHIPSSDKKRQHIVDGSAELQTFSTNNRRQPRRFPGTSSSTNDALHDNQTTYTKVRPRRSPRNPTSDNSHIPKRRKTKNFCPL